MFPSMEWFVSSAFDLSGPIFLATAARDLRYEASILPVLGADRSCLSVAGRLFPLLQRRHQDGQRHAVFGTIRFGLDLDQHRQVEHAQLHVKVA